MQNSIQMELLNATAEKGFSLDELVFKLRELMQEKGMTGIVGFCAFVTNEKKSKKFILGVDIII